MNLLGKSGEKGFGLLMLILIISIALSISMSLPAAYSKLLVSPNTANSAAQQIMALQNVQQNLSDSQNCGSAFPNSYLPLLDNSWNRSPNLMTAVSDQGPPPADMTKMLTVVPPSLTGIYLTKKYDLLPQNDCLSGNVTAAGDPCNKPGVNDWHNYLYHLVLEFNGTRVSTQNEIPIYLYTRYGYMISGCYTSFYAAPDVTAYDRLCTIFNQTWFFNGDAGGFSCNYVSPQTRPTWWEW